MQKIKLGILDQSIVHHGKTVREALQETIATAKLAEQLGYSRFWVSEHHNSTFIAGTAPEVLMVKLADETKRIRIGSGGIMLPNHSAFKMAENFRTLEALFPGRIDMGIGRAPGGDRITAAILNPSNTFSEESYIRQLEHLQHFFSDTAGTQHGPVIAAPQVSSAPEQWILSSSGGSSLIAARFGAGLAIANFINGAVQPEVVEIYKSNFQPSPQFSRPQALIAIGVLCAATEDKARDMRKFIDFVHLQFEKGNFQHFGDYDTIRKYQFSPAEMERIQQNSGRIISGTPDYVKEKLTALAGQFDVDEIIVTTMADRSDDRKHSFELLAEAFELNTGNP